MMILNVGEENQNRLGNVFYKHTPILMYLDIKTINAFS